MQENRVPGERLDRHPAAGTWERTSLDFIVTDLTTVKVAGSCNAILRRADGTLLGDMFDGAGFIRGLKRKGFELHLSGSVCPAIKDLLG